jgi:hypothetical protein
MVRVRVLVVDPFQGCLKKEKYDKFNIKNA